MSITNLLGSFKRLVLHEKLSKSLITRSISTNIPLSFQVTQYLCGEPLKKKKRLDPAIIRAREEKRKKKLEKQIRRLQKNARQPKPIEECEIPMALINEVDLKIRERNIVVNEAEHNARVKLTKQWAYYRYRQSVADVKIIDRLVSAQSRALEELRLESEELYQEAIQIDLAFLPFTARGPVITPPIPGYESPDGDYIDISKKWLN